MVSLKTSVFVLLLIVALALATEGCSSASKAPTSEAGNAQAAGDVQEYPLIVRLEGRNYSVTASSGPAGVVYTATRADGRLIVANATLDELRQRHPEVYQQILPGIADKADSSDGSARTVSDAEHDASVDGPVPLGRRTTSGRELLMMDAAMHSAR